MLLCGLWHGAAWRFVLWGRIHGLYLSVHALYRRIGPPLSRALGQCLKLFAVVIAWVPFRAADIPTSWCFLVALFDISQLALPRMIVEALPWLATVATPVPVLPFLGDARTLSFPEVTACLIVGWLIVLGLPNLHTWNLRERSAALTGSFALTVQALFFAPDVAPFLYFQF